MKTDDLFLNKQRAIADTRADELVSYLFKENLQTALYESLQLANEKITSAELNKEIKIFLLTQRTRPVWYDDKKIERGQHVFKKYALEAMTLLGAYSLPYCYAASPGNKALYLSEKMRKSPGKRLAETAQFIITVLTPFNLTHNAIGHIQINKIRLIHAMARYYLQLKNNWRSEWGVPINQEDMAGTNLAFSYIILRGLIESGFVLSNKEKEDFLFVWKYIGYQLNIDEELLPNTFKEAAQLEQAIKKRHFRKSEEGVQLTKELVDYYKQTVPAPQSSLIESQIRYFLGSETSSLLGLYPEFTKDKIVRSLNSLKSFINFMYVNPNSYSQMLANQVMLNRKV